MDFFFLFVVMSNNLDFFLFGSKQISFCLILNKLFIQELLHNSF